MKKLIFGIFAHPDDEAFGPAGTLLTEVKAGSELHLITLTSGESGPNPDNAGNLGEIRRNEWQEAARRLGATDTHELGFNDGKLCNEIMPHAAEKIIDIVGRVAESSGDDIVIEFITFDFSGVTGHIDHIVATRAACLAFYRLKAADRRFSRVRLYCLPDYFSSDTNVDWLFMEPGKTAGEIDEIVDARDRRDEIINVMQAHQSQYGDFSSALERCGDKLGLDYFVVKS